MVVVVVLTCRRIGKIKEKIMSWLMILLLVFLGMVAGACIFAACVAYMFFGGMR